MPLPLLLRCRSLRHHYAILIYTAGFHACTAFAAMPCSSLIRFRHYYYAITPRHYAADAFAFDAESFFLPPRCCHFRRFSPLPDDAAALLYYLRHIFRLSLHAAIVAIITMPLSLFITPGIFITLITLMSPINWYLVNVHRHRSYNGSITIIIRSSITITVSACAEMCEAYAISILSPGFATFSQRHAIHH